MNKRIDNILLSKVCTKSRKFSSEMPKFPTQRGSAPWTPALVTNFTAPRGEAILDPPVFPCLFLFLFYFLLCV